MALSHKDKHRRKLPCHVLQALLKQLELQTQNLEDKNKWA